ncbi:Hypothetical_protein [Hexamita inflata]|uniref:Hypothetical_protein n=1 Tax=Hexamita inflata TaxID=28002 RepID=A0AA86P842_9EUKA|nr:Hypothetical protein HINF_LOCUS21080 [Hexamita inflata]
MINFWRNIEVVRCPAQMEDLKLEELVEFQTCIKRRSLSILRSSDIITFEPKQKDVQNIPTNFGVILYFYDEKVDVFKRKMLLIPHGLNIPVVYSCKNKFKIVYLQFLDISAASSKSLVTANDDLKLEELVEFIASFLKSTCE